MIDTTTEFQDAIMIKTYLALIILIFGVGMGIGCRKETVGTNPPPVKETKLMNTGYFWDPVESVYHACYWMDEKITELPGPKGKGAFAYGFTTNNNDTYIAGIYDGNASVLTLPCYWKNGVKNDLPTDQFGDFERSSAMDVMIWNNMIYILGAIDLRPVMWIVLPEGTVRQIIIDAGMGTRTVSNFIVHANNLIVGGDKSVATGNNYLYEVGYWRITADGISTWVSMEKNLKYATAFCVNTSGGKIFITGEKNILTNSSINSYMNLWSDNGSVTIHPLDEIAAFRLNEVEPIGDGLLLLNVFDYKTHRPLLLKITENGTVMEQIRPVIPDGLRGYCTSVAYRNGQTAIGGYYLDGAYAHLWFRTGEKDLELKTPYPTHATATRAKWITN